MKNLKLAATTLVIALVVGCVPPPQVPQLTQLEIQSLQTREYEDTKEVVFPSVLSVFQDLGYIVRTADKDTGFITVESPIDGGKEWIPFVGIRSTTNQTSATVFIEQIGQFTRVRLNFVTRKTSSSAYGVNNANDTPILDAGVYQNAFEKIESAIFLRSSN